MAKKVVAKKMLFGKIKVGTSSQEMVDLPNGVRMYFSRDDNDSIESLRIHDKENNNKYEIDAAVLMQASKVLVQADDTKKFVCGQHGSYDAKGEKRQNPECGKCLSEKMEAVNAKVIAREVQLEDDDQ